ncbi:MAG: ligase-associated DNA damage response endonuclease PdeM [Rubrivivax sp.]
MFELHWAGERLVLLPERAAYLPDHGLLLVADAHIGKAATFRRLGVPVPEATTAGTLARLDAALVRTGARGVVFLGDLLHSAHAHAAVTVAAVDAWRRRWPALALHLVRGNHDRRAGDPPPHWRVESVDEALVVGGLQLCHEPHDDAAQAVVAGHVHPGVVIGGRGFDRLRLPCFHLRGSLLLLPAFGEFTGLHVMARQDGDRVFVVAESAVRELPPRGGT